MQLAPLLKDKCPEAFFFWALYSIACSMIDIVWAIEDIMEWQFHKNARLLLYL